MHSQGHTTGTWGHPSPGLLVWAQGQLRAPPHVPHAAHALVTAPWLPTPLQQEFEVVSSSLNPNQRCSSKGSHCPSGHQEDTSLSPRGGSPCVGVTRYQHRQGQCRLPLHHGRGPVLTQAGREGEMFSSGLFCSGVLGFSVCFLWASFSSVYATVVWHHVWQELLCFGASISP